MRAVNPIPADYRKARAGGVGQVRGPAYVLLGLLALGLGVVTLYVVTANSVSDQKSRLAALQQQVPQVQAVAARLTPYTQFATLAQQRAQTVQEIAASRFDWPASLDDLARVIPAGTSLQSLTATSGTNAAAGGGAAAAGGGSGLRSALPDPAFELRGCTGSQDDVARLMSRLRIMSGVVRVSVNNTSQQGSSAAGGAAAAGSQSADCPSKATSFDVIVFFQAPAALPTAQAQPAPAPASSAAPASSPAPSSGSGGS